MGLYVKQIENGPMQNFQYLIGDTLVKKCWIVDPAWDIAPVLDAARTDGYAVEGALVTHAHFDHCNALEALIKHKDVPVHAHKKELEFLDRGAPRGLFADLPREHVKTVEAGDALRLGETTLTFLHTPGHTPGSLCFLVDGHLVAGDTLFLGTCGRCDMPGGNPTQLHDTLNSVLAKLPDDTVLLPGHNYSSKGTRGPLGEQKRTNKFFRAHNVEEFLRLMGF